MRLWPNEALPGELAQVLPTPAHFEQACELVTPDKLMTPMGPDIEAHVESLRQYEEAGIDELFVQQVGPDTDAFFTRGRPRSFRASQEPREPLVVLVLGLRSPAAGAVTTSAPSAPSPTDSCVPSRPATALSRARSWRPATADALEHDESCEQCGTAARDRRQRHGSSARRCSAITAKVDLADGESAFLELTSDGWRIAAAGCIGRSRADQPYECEVEA